MHEKAVQNISFYCMQYYLIITFNIFTLTYLFSVKRCGLDVITTTVISTHCWTERKTQFGSLKKILKKKTLLEMKIHLNKFLKTTHKKTKQREMKVETDELLSQS